MFRIMSSTVHLATSTGNLKPVSQAPAWVGTPPQERRKKTNSMDVCPKTSSHAADLRRCSRPKPSVAVELQPWLIFGRP